MAAPMDAVSASGRLHGGVAAGEARRSLGGGALPPSAPAAPAAAATTPTSRAATIDPVGELAGNWSILAPAEKITIIQRLVAAIVVSTESVDITLRTEAILTLAGCRSDHVATPGRSAHRTTHEDDSETITLSVPGSRSG